MKISQLIDNVIVPPGKKISLSKDYDPAYKPKAVEKEGAAELLLNGVQMLAKYQDMLYAQNRYALLIIFQAMDAAGKDGTIKHVMSGLNPQGTQVHSFKAPSQEELDHDYLWRCAKAAPERGRIGIFNRSYYEEVLVCRVHPDLLARQQLPLEDIDSGFWKRRFTEINNYEKFLHSNGTIVLKFFLNISKAEQKKRFLERIDTPEKNWKFSAADVKERAHWDQYMEAYEDCFNHTSTKSAPWYVIPADRKWFARLAVAAVIYEALEKLDLAYPVVSDEHRASLLAVREELMREKSTS